MIHIIWCIKLKNVPGNKAGNFENTLHWYHEAVQFNTDVLTFSWASNMPFVDGCSSFRFLRTSVLCVRFNQRQISSSSVTATKVLFCCIIFFLHGLLFELFLFWFLIFAWHYTWADWCKTVYKNANYKPCVQYNSMWQTQQVDVIDSDKCEWGVCVYLVF